MVSQEDSELRAFGWFLDVADLRVRGASVERRHPPEPDVLCQLETDEHVAFELVEVCNPANARFAASAHRIHASVMATYSGLPPAIRAAFDARFRHVPLSFAFHRDASIAAIRRELPRLLVELVALPESGGRYTDFSPSVATVAEAIIERGRPNDPDGVNFSLGGSFDPSVPLDSICSKLAKQYNTVHPIELLAHFGARAWGHDDLWRAPLLALLEEKGLGPFRRIWVQDWRGVALVLPDDPRGP